MRCLFIVYFILSSAFAQANDCAADLRLALEKIGHADVLAKNYSEAREILRRTLEPNRVAPAAIEVLDRYEKEGRACPPIVLWNTETAKAARSLSTILRLEGEAIRPVLLEHIKQNTKMQTLGTRQKPIHLKHIKNSRSNQRSEVYVFEHKGETYFMRPVESLVLEPSESLLVGDDGLEGRLLNVVRKTRMASKWNHRLGLNTVPHASMVRIVGHVEKGSIKEFVGVVSQKAVGRYWYDLLAERLEVEVRNLAIESGGLKSVERVTYKTDKPVNSKSVTVHGREPTVSYIVVEGSNAQGGPATLNIFYQQHALADAGPSELAVRYEFEIGPKKAERVITIPVDEHSKSLAMDFEFFVNNVDVKLSNAVVSENSKIQVFDHDLTQFPGVVPALPGRVFGAHLPEKHSRVFLEMIKNFDEQMIRVLGEKYLTPAEMSGRLFARDIILQDAVRRPKAILE